MSDPCNHSWVIDVHSFGLICTKCEAEFLPDTGYKQKSNEKQESPTDAYDRAMKGI